MNTENVVDPLLRRILLVVLIVLAGLCCYFLWQISGTAREIHHLVSRNSEDIDKIVTTAGNVSEDLDRIRAKLSELEEKMRDSLPLEEMDSLLEEAQLFLSNDDANNPDEALDPLSSTDENRIEFLLETIRKSGLRFQYGNRDLSPLGFYLLIKSKYNLHKRLVSSPEDFIEKVATQTIHGKEYRVELEDESSQPLADWLRQKLAETPPGSVEP